MQTDVAQEFGSYFVYEQLGVGGMATVHRAETRGPDGFRKAIALKRLLPQAASSPDTVRSFVDEGRLASNLHHTNVAQAYDLGRVDDTYFIAMELVPGPTLAQIIRRCNEVGRPIPIRIALHILIQICDALDYAHNLQDDLGRPLGLVHRDVSPTNVIVSNSGIVKLIDFGIAKGLLSSRTQTKVGSVKGKVGYIAPEYQRGKLDARVDLFAVGVVAHELLTGRKLFQVKNELESLRRVRELPVDPPSRRNPTVPTDLDDIVLLALRRDPAERWQTAGAMRVALTNAAKACGAIATSLDVRDWVEALFAPVVMAPIDLPESAAVQIVRDPDVAVHDEIALVLSSLGGIPDRPSHDAFDVSDVEPATIGSRPPVPAVEVATIAEVAVPSLPRARSRRVAMVACGVLALAGAGTFAAQLLGVV